MSKCECGCVVEKMSKHLNTSKHARRMMMAAKREANGTPEKPKFAGVAWEGNVAKYAETEEVGDDEMEEDARKYLGARVEWEWGFDRACASNTEGGNRVYLKEVFEGDEDETVHEIGGRVQPKERGKVVWRGVPTPRQGNVAYYEPAEGVDAWDDTRSAPSPYAKPESDGGGVVWEQREDGSWLVKMAA